VPAASEISICNRGLTKLGARTISSFTDGSVAAGHCKNVYYDLRDLLLQKYRWDFTIKRVALAADTTPPVFNRTTACLLPADYLILLPDDPEIGFLGRDWIVEGRYLITNDPAPINIRYTSKVTDVSLFHPLFIEALACKIAEELCEVITQSNTKKAAAVDGFRLAIIDAKRIKAIELPPTIAQDGSWITARSAGSSGPSGLGWPW